MTDLESSSHAERESAASSARQALKDVHAAKLGQLLEQRRVLDAQHPIDLAAIDTVLAEVADELHGEILVETRKALAKWSKLWRTQPSRQLTAALAEIVSTLAPRTRRELGCEFDSRNILIAMADEMITTQPLAVGAFAAHLLTDQSCLSLAEMLMRVLHQPVDAERTILEIEAALARLAASRPGSSPACTKRWQCVSSAATFGRRHAALAALTVCENQAHLDQASRDFEARRASAPKNPSAWIVNASS